MRTTVLTILASGLLLAGGCKSFDTDSKSPSSWFGEKEPVYQTPARLAAIWSDAMLNHPTTPTRGFGGRIYFYNNKNEAVPVSGELVVYAFDDTNGISEGRRPDRKFVFKADQLTAYYSETQLGASYSIWVPWDRPGGGGGRAPAGRDE